MRMWAWRLCYPFSSHCRFSTSGSLTWHAGSSAKWNTVAAARGKRPFEDWRLALAEDSSSIRHCCRVARFGQSG